MDISNRPASPPSFLMLCFRRDILLRAVRIALVVGTLLAIINHGEILTGAPVGAVRLGRILLTYFVPYGVATYSSVQSIRKQNSVAASPGYSP